MKKVILALAAITVLALNTQAQVVGRPFNLEFDHPTVDTNWPANGTTGFKIYVNYTPVQLIIATNAPTYRVATNNTTKLYTYRVPMTPVTSAGNYVFVVNAYNKDVNVDSAPLSVMFADGPLGPPVKPTSVKVVIQ